MSSFAISSILNAPMENPSNISLYDDAVPFPECGICISHCACTDHNQFANYFESDVAFEFNDTENLAEANIEYVYEEEDNYAFVEVEENKEGEFEIVELEDYSEERPQQIEIEGIQEEVEIDEVGTTAADYEDNSDSDRCTTPVQNEWDERWEIIKNLEYTERHREMEFDAEEVAAMNYKDTCFTVIKNEEEFVIVVPFGDKPVYKSVVYPVSEEMMRDLFLTIPSWVGYRIRALATQEGFSEFGRFFEYNGSGYRLAALMRRALNAVKRPEMKKILDEMLPVEGEAEEIIEAPIGRIRAGRAKRNGAAEIDGRTPLGRRLPMRQKVLFREEEDGEERTAKRRRLDLELED
ncbi:hypothetical protein PRIPAC_88233 [Pristionchus pacificus]|uniref:Uncharacterized protein n=1 Tax=Pristionchus pacificus TaxID=54126 RepID=A0A2A6B7Q4_PRIPA|nr:hypothetical protein PRIPAC_88233 [Pristionchus pacificus]|eukprot:PDM61908.1 hypothetical protein PRIPAC_51350 [Pristionchus pacificus]